MKLMLANVFILFLVIFTNVTVAELDDVTVQSEQQLLNYDQRIDNYTDNIAFVIQVDTKLTLSACKKLGGECFHGKKDCPDILPIETKNGKPYCKSRRERCCYPAPKTTPAPEGCPVDAGFFWFPSSNQCFKLMTDRPWFTWEGADDVCKKENLTLAHPFDAIGLRSYLAQRYGQFDAFLNARGDGEAITWLDNGVQISNNSLLWRNRAPFGVTDGFCLLLADAYWKEETNQPFWATPCTWKKSFRYPLCELDISKTSGCAFGK